MQEILPRFSEVATDPYKTLAEWKRQNKRKIIGCFPMHIPEEIIHAAGMLPVVLWRSNELVTLGNAHWSPVNCSLSRSFVDDAVKGKLNFIDGMVFYDTCLQARAMPFIISRNARPAYLEIIDLPGMLAYPTTRPYVIENLEKLKTGLEEFGGQKITTEALKRSIDIYNKNRRLLRKLYGIRRQKPGLLKAKEVVAMVHASMLMPKEEHNGLLEKLLPQLEKAEPPPSKKISVILVGCLCQAPRSDMVDLIEEAGMVVVDDDLYTGSRYFANDVDEGGNPIESLADRYLKRIPPCATKPDWEVDWSDYIIEIVGKNRAQAVITLLVKYCPPHLVYYPDIKRRLAAAGIPELMLEMEHEAVSLEQVRVRLQAFIETIGGA